MSFGYEPLNNNGKILYARCYDEKSYQENIAKLKPLVTTLYTECEWHSSGMTPVYKIYIPEKDADRIINLFNERKRI